MRADGARPQAATSATDGQGGGVTDTGGRHATPAMTAPDIERFLAYLRVERQTSPHTLDAYRRDLLALAQHAQARGQALAALDSEGLRGFIAAEHRRGLGAKSLQRRLSACRSLYEWLLRHGEIRANPAQGVRAPKAPRK